MRANTRGGIISRHVRISVYNTLNSFDTSKLNWISIKKPSATKAKYMLSTYKSGTLFSGTFYYNWKVRENPILILEEIQL